MVKVLIEGQKAVFEVQGWHKVWAVTSRLEVPLEHIESVTAKPEDADKWWHGWKILGTDLPGTFAAGMFRLAGKWVFWDVKEPDNTIEIELKDEFYDRLLMEVEDPKAAVATLKEAIASGGAMSP